MYKPDYNVYPSLLIVMREALYLSQMGDGCDSDRRITEVVAAYRKLKKE